MASVATEFQNEMGHFTQKVEDIERGIRDERRKILVKYYREAIAKLKCTIDADKTAANELFHLFSNTNVQWKPNVDLDFADPKKFTITIDKIDDADQRMEFWQTLFKGTDIAISASPDNNRIVLTFSEGNDEKHRQRLEQLETIDSKIRDIAALSFSAKHRAERLPSELNKTAAGTVAQVVQNEEGDYLLKLGTKATKADEKAIADLSRKKVSIAISNKKRELQEKYRIEREPNAAVQGR